MPIPKILASFLHKSQRYNSKLKKDIVPPPVAVVKDVVLSPALPYSSPKYNNSQNVNEKGDPIIGLDTIEEDGSSAKSDESIMEKQQEEQVEENTTAVVLHENPTAFELCDNDLIIESVREVQQEEGEEQDADYDTDMMRDNNNAMTVYKANTTVATTSAETIDFTSPEEKEEEEQQIATIIELTNEEAQLEGQEATEKSAPLSASPPFANMVEEASIHQEQEVQKFGFIKPVQAEVLHTVFASSKLEEEKKHAHFPMETTFKRHESNAGFTSTCKKAICSAKALIWKLDNSRHMKCTKLTLSTKFDNDSTNPAGRETPANKNMEFGYGVTKKQEEKVEETPIYRRFNTSGNYLASEAGTEEQQDPLEGYRSPDISTNAYDIKKLCDQSFFGRW